MKASLKFREEKNPLLRAKLPFNAGALPLLSGVAVGDCQELAVHVGTFFSAGPAIKLAFKPNGPSPLSAVLKAGLGHWGSPNGAPITVKAEFYFAPKHGDPAITLQIKPRLGDFSFQKNLDCAEFARRQQKVADSNLAPSPVSAAGENLGMSTPPSVNGDGRALSKRNSSNPSVKDRLRSPSLESSAVVIGSNFSLKIEGLHREWKGQNEKRAKAEGTKDHRHEGEGGKDHLHEGGVTADGDGNLMPVPHGESHEHGSHDSKGRSLGALSFTGVHHRLQGCRFAVHSSLPAGKQARLHVRWGIKAPSDLFHGWDGSSSSISFSKLPSLLLDKISLEQGAALPNKEKPCAAGWQNGCAEGGFLPVQFMEENQELAQVAMLCMKMKRQLHLLYAENQVLKRSMEDMKSQIEFRGFRSSKDGVDPDSPRAFNSGREGSPWKAEAQKGQKDMATDVR